MRIHNLLRVSTYRFLHNSRRLSRHGRASASAFFLEQGQARGTGYPVEAAGKFLSMAAHPTTVQLASVDNANLAPLVLASDGGDQGCSIMSASYCITTAEPTSQVMDALRVQGSHLDPPLQSVAGCVVDDTALVVPLCLAEEALSLVDQFFAPYGQESIILCSRA